jgi:threonine synthase
MRYLDENSGDKNIPAISLETAHPAKFPDQIKAILSIDPELPESLAGLENLEEKYLRLSGKYEEFRDLLKDKYLK